MSTTRRRLHFGSSQCSFIYTGFVPVDEPLQVPSIHQSDVLPLRSRKRFTAQQVDVLNSAFEMDEIPDRQREQALASSLGVQVKRIQSWFKNARSKRRRQLLLQKMAYTDNDVQRWKRRMSLRRTLNGSPAATNNRKISIHIPQPLESSHLQHPPQQIFSDHVTPFYEQVTNPCFETPKEVFPCTPMPQGGTDWDCYAPVKDLPSELLVSKTTTEITCPASQVCFQTEAFHDSSFIRLFGKLLDSLLKEERMI